MIWREVWCFEGWASRRRPPAFQIYSAVLSLFTRIVHSRKSTALSIDCAVSRRFPFLLGYYNGLLFVAYFERAFKVFPFVVSSGRRRLFCSRLTPMMSFTICVRVEIRVFRWSVEILRRVADWLFRLLAAWPPYTTVGTTMTTRTTKSWPSCWTQLWKEISEFFCICFFDWFAFCSSWLIVYYWLFSYFWLILGHPINPRQHRKFCWTNRHVSSQEKYCDKSNRKCPVTRRRARQLPAILSLFRSSTHLPNTLIMIYLSPKSAVELRKRRRSAKCAGRFFGTFWGFAKKLGVF